MVIIAGSFRSKFFLFYLQEADLSPGSLLTPWYEDLTKTPRNLMQITEKYKPGQMVELKPNNLALYLS